MLVVVVVSTGSGPPPTLDSPLSPFRRFVLPLFTSHPRARHIPLFSSIRLSSFHFAFFVSPAPFLSSILTARSSFLPAPPFHRSVLMLFPRLLSSFLPSLCNHFILFLVFLHFMISVQILIELDWLCYQLLTTIVPVELLSRYQALEFLGQIATRMRIYSLTNRRYRMESQR